MTQDIRGRPAAELAGLGAGGAGRVITFTGGPLTTPDPFELPTWSGWNTVLGDPREYIIDAHRFEETRVNFGRVRLGVNVESLNMWVADPDLTFEDQPKTTPIANPSCVVKVQWHELDLDTFDEGWKDVGNVPLKIDVTEPGYYLSDWVNISADMASMPTGIFFRVVVIFSAEGIFEMVMGTGTVELAGSKQAAVSSRQTLWHGSTPWPEFSASASFDLDYSGNGDLGSYSGTYVLPTPQGSIIDSSAFPPPTGQYNTPIAQVTQNQFQMSPFLLNTPSGAVGLGGAGTNGEDGGFIGYFMSGPLEAQTIPAGRWTMAFRTYKSPDNLSNTVGIYFRVCCWVWRPSAGLTTNVGTIYASDVRLGNYWDYRNPEANTSGIATHVLGATLLGDSLSVQKGDRLIWELWYHADNPLVGMAGVVEFGQSGQRAHGSQFRYGSNFLEINPNAWKAGSYVQPPQPLRFAENVSALPITYTRLSTCFGCVDFTVTPVAGAVAYKWIFGDGTTDTTEEPETTHDYLDSGNYDVLVSAIDSEGYSISFGVQIKIGVTNHSDEDNIYSVTISPYYRVIDTDADFQSAAGTNGAITPSAPLEITFPSSNAPLGFFCTIRGMTSGGTVDAYKNTDPNQNYGPYVIPPSSEYTLLGPSSIDGVSSVVITPNSSADVFQIVDFVVVHSAFTSYRLCGPGTPLAVAN